MQENWLSFILDNLLNFTLVVVFLTGIINIFIQQRKRDICLKDFEDFNVVMKKKDGSTIFGLFELSSNGTEFLYPTPFLDKKRDLFKYSQLLTKTEFDEGIFSLHRYYDDLSLKEKRRRLRKIKKSYRPGPLRKLIRAIRNMVYTLKDAFKKSVQLILGVISQKIGADATTKTELTSAGDSITESLNNSYDPLLEKQIGKVVIVEITKDDAKKQYEGIFKEYSDTYLELLRVNYPLNFKLNCNELYNCFNMEIKRENNNITIKNNNELKVSIIDITDGEWKHPVDKKIKKNEEVIIEVNNLDKHKNSTLQINIERVGDIVVPRTNTKVIHGGKREKITIKELLRIEKLITCF